MIDHVEVFEDLSMLICVLQIYRKPDEVQLWSRLKDSFQLL